MEAVITQNEDKAIEGHLFLHEVFSLSYAMHSLSCNRHGNFQPGTTGIIPVNSNANVFSCFV
jgi:hypothetical protein